MDSSHQAVYLHLKITVEGFAEDSGCKTMVLKMDGVQCYVITQKNITNKKLILCCFCRFVLTFH